MKSQKRTYTIGALVLCILAAAFVLPISVPYTITTTGIVLPSKEWVLLRGAGGQIQSVLRDNERGSVGEYALMEAARGDAMTFQLSPSIRSRAAVQAGDTVGWVSSPELAQQLAALEGDLAVARATLDVSRTGEKPATVEQATRQVNYARTAFEEQQAIHARNMELHGRQAISDQEFQISRDRLALLRIGIDIARAQLDVVSTGMKSEEQQARAALIDARRAEIEALRRRLMRLVRVSPLSGLVRASWSPDTLLVVQDTSASALLLPVRIAHAQHLHADQEVRLSLRGTDMSGTARITRAGEGAQTIAGEMFVIAAAQVRAVSMLPPAGTRLRCTIACGDVSLGEYLRRTVQDWTRGR
ncbi:MAG: hypothetical protein HY962_12015 [Ignavibacteriae bacterium]|nr:hypothetical protein [Ignavibacteriota bacterium]